MEVDGEESDEYEEIEEEIEVTDDDNDNDDDDIHKHPSPSPDGSRGMKLEMHTEYLVLDSMDPVVDSTGESKFSIGSKAKEEEMEIEEEEEEEEMGVEEEEEEMEVEEEEEEVEEDEEAVEDEEEDEEAVEDEEEKIEDVDKEPSVSLDVGRGMELEEHKEHLISDSFFPVVDSSCEPKLSIVSEAKNEARVNVDESLKFGMHDDLVSIDDKKDPVASVERGAPNDVEADNGQAFVDHGTVEPSVDGKEVAVAISTKDGSAQEANGVVDVKPDTKNVGEQSREDVSEGLTSSSLPQIRLRSLSPVAELNTMNKKPAIVCDFFAKGWCIKGSSCKFLHVKDHTSINSQKPKGDEGKIELRSDIGMGDTTERSKAIASPMGTIFPVSLKRSQSRELGESHNFHRSFENLPHQQEGPSHEYKDSSRSNSSFRDFGLGGDNMKLNSVEDNSDNRSRQFNSSTWTRAHFSIDFLDKDPLRAYGSTSLLRSSSPFSGSESKTHSLKDFSMDPLPVASHRTKVSYDDWEPSVPFRPSFPYTKNLLAPLTLYDPIRDSIEQTKSADRLPKLPLRLETTISHTHGSTDKDPALPRIIEPNCGSDKQSISGHDKDFHNRYLLSTEGETLGTYNDEQNSGSNLPKEEKQKPSTHDEQNSGSNLPKEGTPSEHGKDGAAEVKKENHDSISRLQKNGISRKKELNLDSGRDGDHGESKAMRIFRVALIDFIKDLVRPTWLEGRVSKDAHKKIVKNAVEKVLSTVQPHATPSTEESINQYLLISKPKMAKLVEGYVVKYGKS